VSRNPRIAVLALSAIIAMTPVAVSAQDMWERQVLRQLNAVAAAADSEANYVASHDPFTGSLRNNNYTEIQYTLQAGVHYLLTGVCDNDCSDLDLELYDGNHRLVSRDTGSDDKPIVGVTVGVSGRFYLRVIMARCSTLTCRYGTQAFRPAN